MESCTFCGVHVQKEITNEIADTWLGISAFEKEESKEKKKRWGCPQCIEIINKGMRDIHDFCEKVQDKTKAKLLRRQLTNSILETTNQVDGPLSGGQFKRKFMKFFLDFTKKPESTEMPE